MGTILGTLPKIIVVNPVNTGMRNFTEAEKETPKCDCGCGNAAGCCAPPKRLDLAGRRRSRLRNSIFRNFARVEFLYTPNVPGDFAGFYRNCCGQ